jgi:inosose dehydratase
VTTSLSSDRIAGAPISWGLCEVPGWGYQLTPQRVLSEMQALGLVATEFGPPGFLETDSNARVAQLAEHGLVAVGGFHVAVLHDPGHDPLPGVDAFIDECLAAKAGMVVLAAGTGQAGYDVRPVLDDAQIGLCVDTGHLAAAGADPGAIVRAYPGRVRHVHLKDVDSALAAQVVAGSLSFADAVRRGMFVPLGTGDVDVTGIVAALEGAGYRGWYVLEQDVMLPGEPGGEGPVADVRRCLTYLTGDAR